MIALATLLAIVMLSLLATRVAAAALVLTGVSPDVAQFQARSALSGTGFATSEAELMMSHPARRQIVRSLMLLGNAGLVTTIASLSLSFAGSTDTTDTLLRLGLLLAGLAALLLLARNERVTRVLNRAIRRVLRHYTDLEVKDYAGLLHVGMDFAVNQLRVETDEWLDGQTLASSKLSAEGVVVLGIERSDGTYLAAPTGSTPLVAGDTLLIYGHGPCLAELANRPQGPGGHEAHATNVAANAARIAAETAADPVRRSMS